MLILGGFQVIVARNYSPAFLLTLICLLVAEVFFTSDSINAQTTYVQLLIMLNRLVEDFPRGETKIIQLFAITNVAPMIANHCLQLCQWILAISSTFTAAIWAENEFRSATQGTEMTGVGDGNLIATISSFENPVYSPVEEITTDLTNSTDLTEVVDDNDC